MEAGPFPISYGLLLQRLFLLLSSLGEGGKFQKGLSLEVALHVCGADGRAVSLTLLLLTLNPRREYQFSASSVAGVEVLLQPRLRSPFLKRL